ncbi:hypothetical protein A5736_01560 [Mycobacterium sp. SP-6446]|nr:hypothetical protein A5736_01560 [Mycobacterium sp. SP-6446]
MRVVAEVQAVLRQREATFKEHRVGSMRTGGACWGRSTGIGARDGGRCFSHSTGIGGGGDSVRAEADCSAKSIGIGGRGWPLGLGGLGGMGGAAACGADGSLTSKSVCASGSSESSVPSRDWKSRS